MVVVFPGRGADNFWDSFAAVPLLRRGAGPPRCLSWAQAAALRHVPRRHTCLEAIVNVARILRSGTDPSRARVAAQERHHKLQSPTDRPDSFEPSCWSALRGGVLGPESALTHASERSKPARGTLPAAAVQAATKTFGQRMSRREKVPHPRRRQRQRPEAAPTRKGRHFVAQQRRRKLSSPTVGPDSL